MMVNPGSVKLALVAKRRTPRETSALKSQDRKLGRFVRAVAEPGTSGFAAAIAFHSCEILQAWDAFAATLARADRPLDSRQLRGNAAGILADVILVLSNAAQDRSTHAGGAEELTAAEQHADARRDAGFTLEDTLAEYAALRAGVLRTCAPTTRVSLREVVAFNAVIDAALQRCAHRFEMQTKAATDLFLGILAHDIRNPLATILNRTQLALLTGQTPPARGMPVINAARRIQGIVEQTVDFTRLQSFGALPVVRKFADLGVLLAKVVEETQLRHAGAKILLGVDGDLWGTWDGGRLAQVLSNLLANAITYGSRESVIDVRVWAAGCDAFIAVHNHGAPIPPEEAVRIFDPLFRGGGAERRAREGLGLGLYICREIVRAHGGHLWVESDRDAGTRFTARLAREGEPAERTQACAGEAPGLRQGS